MPGRPSGKGCLRKGQSWEKEGKVMESGRYEKAAEGKRRMYELLLNISLNRNIALLWAGWSGDPTPPISVAARLLGLRVRIPPGTWMFVSCVLSKEEKAKCRTTKKTNKYE